MISPSTIEGAVDDPKAPPPMLLPEPQQQLVSESVPTRHSLKPELSLQPGAGKNMLPNFRQQSANYNQIMSQGQRFGEPSIATVGAFEEEE